MTIKIDPAFKKLIPPLSESERNILEQNILDEGCRDPLVVWNGILLDGHNRYEICQANDIPFDTVSAPVYVRSRDDAEDWIDRNQLGRRNLTRESFSMILGRRLNRIAPKQGARTDLTSDQNETKLQAAGRLAAEHNVSPATVKRAGKAAEAADKIKQQHPDLTDDQAIVMAPVVDEPETIESIIKDAAKSGKTASVTDLKKAVHRHVSKMGREGNQQIKQAMESWTPEQREEASPENSRQRGELCRLLTDISSLPDPASYARKHVPFFMKTKQDVLPLCKSASAWIKAFQEECKVITAKEK